MIVSKTFTFNAGHRLKDYDGCCSNVHGHNYRCIVSIEGPLENNGMVLDFKEMKVIKKWIDKELDHSFIYEEGDHIGEYLRSQGMKVFPLEVPPTTEHLAMIIFEQSQSMGFAVESVELWETDKCKVVYRKEKQL